MSTDPDTYHSTTDPDFGASPEPPDPPEGEPEPTPELLADAAHDASRALAGAAAARVLLLSPEDDPAAASGAAQEALAGAITHAADALRVLTGQQPDADQLAAMIADFQDHIDARASEIADPRIAAIQAEADERVWAIEAHAQSEGERSGDLVAELRRQLASCDRTIERLARERDEQLRGIEEIQRAIPEDNS